MFGGEPNREPTSYLWPMGDISGRRRGHGEDAIYFDADKNRYIGAISLGFGPSGKRIRRKVSGKTKQEVRDKLRELHAELTAGLQPKVRYTVQAAVDAWLEHGLSGRSARTVQLYRDGVQPLMDRLGSRRLGELSAGDVPGSSGQPYRPALYSVAADCT